MSKKDSNQINNNIQTGRVPKTKYKAQISDALKNHLTLLKDIRDARESNVSQLEIEEMKKQSQFYS